MVAHIDTALEQAMLAQLPRTAFSDAWAARGRAAAIPASVAGTPGARPQPARQRPRPQAAGETAPASVQARSQRRRAWQDSNLRPAA
jgi:hypothetical protein